jgi:transposase
MTTNYAALVGLDWGDQTHAFSLQWADGTSEKGMIEARAEAVHVWLEQLHERTGGGPVALAIEAGKNAVVHALLGHPGLTIFPVHTAASENFRKALVPSGAKDDLPDAEILLTMLAKHRDALRPLRPDEPATRRLTALVEIRRGLVDQRTQLGQELISTLKGYFPQALELIGDDRTAPLALDFLARWPELLKVQAARPATVQAFYFAHNVRRPAVVAQRLERIRAARALTNDRAVVEPAVLRVAALVALLRPLARHIDILEQQISTVFAAHPDAALFRELPGAGPTFAPRLLTAFGSDRSRYPSASSLQKYSGVAPLTERSGRQLWIHWRWHAPKFLRQTFVEWAGQTVVHSTWAKAYYFQQKRAGKRHQAILRALAFKWIRIVWRCWQTRTLYDESRYTAALIRRHSPLAATLAPP